MPDLITIQGSFADIRALTDIATLEIIDETDKMVDTTNFEVTAFADAAATTAVQGRGLIVTLIKTEAQCDADIQEAYSAINDVPYNFGGNV